MHCSQGRGGGDGICGRQDAGSAVEAYLDPVAHQHRPTEHKGAGSQRGVEEVLTQPAEQLLDHHDREEIADQRGRLGDYEGDTVYGSVGKGYLITSVDRLSRLTVAAIAKDKTTESTNDAFIAAFGKAKLVPPITLTLDNGTEFLGFKDLEQILDIKVYFADAHAPWQRGSNENVNGLIRFFFPRGTDFTKVTDEQLDAVLELINNRPRKCLGYLSPNEFINKVLHLA